MPVSFNFHTHSKASFLSWELNRYVTQFNRGYEHGRGQCKDLASWAIPSVLVILPVSVIKSPDKKLLKESEYIWGHGSGLQSTVAGKVTAGRAWDLERNGCLCSAHYLPFITVQDLSPGNDAAHCGKVSLHIHKPNRGNCFRSCWVLSPKRFCFLTLTIKITHHTNWAFCSFVAP